MGVAPRLLSLVVRRWEGVAVADTGRAGLLTRQEFYWSQGLVWLFMSLLAWQTIPDNADWTRWWVFIAPALMAVVCTAASVLSERRPGGGNPAEPGAADDRGPTG